MRIAIVSDIHGNIAALDAALMDIETHQPDRLFIAGDLVMNGPRPSETVQRVMALEKAGAYVVQGNTDIAVADGDYAAVIERLVAAGADIRAAGNGQGRSLLAMAEGHPAVQQTLRRLGAA